MPQALRYGTAHAFWFLEATRTAPGQRAQAEAAVDAPPRAPLCPDCEIVSAPTYRRRPAPRGLRHPAGHRAGLSGLWLEHEYRLCRATQPRYPPAGRGDRTPGQHAVSGRSELAGSACLIPGLSQLRLAPREPSPTVAGARSHERSWLGQGVAAVYTGHGGGIDGPCVVAQRGIVLPSAAVAPAADGLINGAD